MQHKKISDEIEAAIGDPGLQDAAAGLAEVVLDTALQEGILRDIPVLGTLVGMTRTAVAIRDRLFLRKLCYFLTELGTVPREDRASAIRELQESRQHQVSVGEKLLYIIDRCQDHQASGNIGRVFKAFLEGAINYAEFVRLAIAIDRLIAEDLDDFLRKDWQYIPVPEATYLIGTELVEFDELEITVEDQDDWKASDKYVVSNRVLTVSLSDIGAKLKSILGPYSSQAGPPGLRTSDSA